MPVEFLDKTCKKRSKTEKVKITIKFYIFKTVHVPNFMLNKQFQILEQINPKSVFPI